MGTLPQIVANAIPAPPKWRRTASANVATTSRSLPLTPRRRRRIACEELEPLDPRLQVLRFVELQVVLCLCAGDSCEAIAAYTELSVRSVRRYLKSAASRLGLASVDEIRRQFAD